MIQKVADSELGPLHGIRVLDLSRVLAGPWASQLLADFGADVIKVERPGQGDDTRSWGPPWVTKEDGTDSTDSAYFLAANRNKRSITLNLAHAGGQEIVRALATKSDVLIENFKPGTMTRFHLDYEELQSVNSDLVYCSLSAFGQTGSRSTHPGYDAMIQAEGGLMSITGVADEDGGEPQKVGVAIADIMAGMYAASAIIAALTARERGATGQHIDLSLYDSQVAWLANQNMNYLMTGEVPGRLGTAHPNLVPYQVFATADSHLMLAVGNDQQFVRCTQCLQLPELADDPDYRSNAARIKNRPALITKMAARIRKQSTEFWIRKLTDAGVPAGPINNLENVFENSFAEERELVRHLAHPVAGSVPTVSNPVRFNKTPVEYAAAPPTLGQHTREILRSELDLADRQIDELQASGAI